MSNDFPSYQDLFRIARDRVITRSRTLTRDVVDRAGTDANAMTAAAAAVGDACIGQLVQLEAANSLDSARGEKLARLVFDRFGIVRKGATPAIGEVTFTTPTNVAVGFSIPAGTKVQTASGVQFTTNVTTTFPTGTAGPVTVGVTSTQAGLSQHVLAGAITSVADTLPGAPGTLTVTNAYATVGAGEEEKDDELAARARTYYATAQRGTAAAIERGALSVAGVRTAKAFSALSDRLDPARFVQVVVADQYAQQFATANTATPAYVTQSQALATNVRAALTEFSACGIYVEVVVGMPVLVGITLNVRVRAGFDHESTVAQARALAVAYVNELKPGAPIIKADLELRVSQCVGLDGTGGIVLSPQADITSPGALTVFRTQASLVTVGICYQQSGIYDVPSTFTGDALPEVEESPAPSA